MTLAQTQGPVELLFRLVISLFECFSSPLQLLAEMYLSTSRLQVCLWPSFPSTGSLG